MFQDKNKLNRSLQEEDCLPKIQSAPADFYSIAGIIMTGRKVKLKRRRPSDHFYQLSISFTNSMFLSRRRIGVF